LLAHNKLGGWWW